MTTCFDSNILIYFVENNVDFGEYATELLIKAIDDEGAVFSVLALTELLSHRLTTAQHHKLETFRKLVIFLPVTEVIATKAGQLRLAHASLRTPDALHLATALVHKASFQTHDKRLAKIAALVKA
ncbi:MAG: PIN domain-containing protein [Candidatus Saccharimonadales bacterium]